MTIQEFTVMVQSMGYSAQSAKISLSCCSSWGPESTNACSVQSWRTVLSSSKIGAVPIRRIVSKGAQLSHLLRRNGPSCMSWNAIGQDIGSFHKRDS